LVLHVLSAGECVAALPIVGGETLPREPFDVTLAGALDPGSATAAWRRSEALIPAGLATVADARLPPFEPVAPGRVSTERRSIPIRYFGWMRRRPSLDVSGHAVRLIMRNYVSDPWYFDARDLAAVDSTREFNGTVDEDLDIDLPVMKTRGNFTTPNLTLLFKTPQRVPRLRPLAGADLPWTYRRSRSPQGETADGIQLQTSDPRGALEILAAAGAAVPERPLEWLRAARPELWKPALRAEVRRRRRQSTVMSVAAAILMFGSFGVLTLLGDNASNVAFVSVFALGSIGFVLLMLADRRRRKSGRS
jgi:hypothetical protein